MLAFSDNQHDVILHNVCFINVMSYKQNMVQIRITCAALYMTQTQHYAGVTQKVKRLFLSLNGHCCTGRIKLIDDYSYLCKVMNQTLKDDLTD